MPPSEPLRVVSGVLKSGCASRGEHPDLERLARRPRMLQPGDQPWHGWAGRQQPDREVAVPLVLRHNLGEVTERHPQPFPPAILRGFVRRKRRFLDAHDGAQIGE
jgi:hypothetical protein